MAKTICYVKIQLHVTSQSCVFLRCKEFLSPQKLYGGLLHTTYHGLQLILCKKTPRIFFFDQFLLIMIKTRKMQFRLVWTGFLRFSLVFLGLAIIGNRLRLRSVQIRQKNRTEPDLRTLGLAYISCFSGVLPYCSA